MSAPQSLFQATINRLTARLSSGLADTLATLVALVEEAPERWQQEWQLFRQEVEQEADRLERGDEVVAEAPRSTPQGPETSGSPLSPQERIDALRARVAQLSARLEERP